MYFWVKSLHLLFVLAWAASAFYLPRILINMAEAGNEPLVNARLELMGRRLYRFGHIMFGIAMALGLWLWFGFGISGGWLHAKLTLVILLVAFYVMCGRWLKKGYAALPAANRLRLINELPILLVLGVIYLVIAKPF